MRSSKRIRSRRNKRSLKKRVYKKRITKKKGVVRKKSSKKKMKGGMKKFFGSLIKGNTNDKETIQNNIKDILNQIRTIIQRNETPSQYMLYFFNDNEYNLFKFNKDVSINNIEDFIKNKDNIVEFYWIQSSINIKFNFEKYNKNGEALDENSTPINNWTRKSGIIINFEKYPEKYKNPFKSRVEVFF